mmetsp:Transcript_9641/g.20891  ORF Transcript_9641/g.20891 Transcript_9641/m.20891 type:complete len:232 (-) Transcript_9641:295-990(-)
MAPPSMSLFLTSRRRDKNTSYPSIALSCVDVMGLPCRFISINSVSVQSSFGRGWGFVAEMWFFRNDRTLSFFSLPTAEGKLTTTLLSRFKSLSESKLAMLSGTVARLFEERSSFSNIFRGLLLLTMLRGIVESELFESSIVLRPLGSGVGNALVFFFISAALATGRPSKLLLAESVFSFVKDDMEVMLPGVSVLLSTFSDLRTFRLESFELRLTSLFLDRSSVVSLEISKT